MVSTKEDLCIYIYRVLIFTIHILTNKYHNNTMRTDDMGKTVNWKEKVGGGSIDRSACLLILFAA